MEPTSIETIPAMLSAWVSKWFFRRVLFLHFNIQQRALGLRSQFLYFCFSWYSWLINSFVNGESLCLLLGDSVIVGAALPVPVHHLVVQASRMKS